MTPAFFRSWLLDHVYRPSELAITHIFSVLFLLRVIGTQMEAELNVSQA